MSLAVPAAVDLRSRIRGEVIEPDHHEYDGARRLWNARFDRWPALIARPLDATEVAIALRFARGRDMPIAVRCGGHSNTGQSSRDGGLVIDLRHLGAVEVDRDRRTATVGGGSLLKALDVAAQEHGLVCPVGVVGHTGVGGLTLGGGIGRLQRHFGLTIDNLRAVQLVTADGRFVRASAEVEPELFWAIRGAGTNYGVVTSFEFDLQPFGGTLHRGTRIHPAERLHDVWATFAAYGERAPDAVSPILAIGRAEASANDPPELAGQPIVIVGFNHSGAADAVERDIAALDAGLQPVARTDASAPYLEVQVSGDDAMGWGHRSAISGVMTDGIAAPRLDALLEHVRRAPAGLEASVGIALLGGAIGRVPDDATAYGSRHARFDVSADATWEDAALDEAADDWVAEAMAIVQPDALPGRYVNEISQSGPEVARSVYADRYDRLARIKRAWDPDNVFHGNQNIEPA